MNAKPKIAKLNVGSKKFIRKLRKNEKIRKFHVISYYNFVGF